MHMSDIKPIAILLMGPPGSGKGTQAVSLSQYLQLPHISTGDLFRENIFQKTTLGLEASAYINQGKLVPDFLVSEMLFARIAKEDCKNGYILDGFPRTIPQAESLDGKIGQTHQLVVLYFHLDDQIIIERLSGRIVCKGCSSPYHLKYAPPISQNICDTCHGNLYQRDDDQEHIVRKRLQVYQEQTAPLIANYLERKVCFKKIDSSQKKEQVVQDALEALGDLLPIGRF
jgi:adenylate kinase